MSAPHPLYPLLPHTSVEFRYCFNCCVAIDNTCEAHALLRSKHEGNQSFIPAVKVRLLISFLISLDDERLFDEVVESSQKKKNHFSHHEEKFDSLSQTVVIWCLRDFIRNKKYVSACVPINRNHILDAQLIKHSASPRFSEDVFNAEQKAKRQQLLRQKRGRS